MLEALNPLQEIKNGVGHELLPGPERPKEENVVIDLGDDRVGYRNRGLVGIHADSSITYV